MAITIDNESKQRQLQPIDINFMSERFKTENSLFSFPAPELEVIDKYLFFLLRNSVEKTFDKKYTYRPDYLSYDEYGTVSLAYLLMYVNSVPSIEDFDLERVVIPDYASIVEILKDKVPTQDTEDLTEVDL